MANQATYTWLMAVLGEGEQYPGHPLVVASMIMDRYPNLEAALERPEGTDYGNALSDSFIPGAGCAVYAALDTLRVGQAEGAEAAAEVAQRYWDSWERQSPRNAGPADRGRRQAVRIWPRFVQLLPQWGTPDYPVSAYRVVAPAATGACETAAGA